MIEISSYFNCHAHTMYSNIRLLDCINHPKKLIDKAIELGLSGIAITDHECLSSHMEVNLYTQEILKEHPDFKVALGNEIYLVDERGPGQKYYHFILIAKDIEGHKALKELSSIAWYNSYTDRGLERVPTTKAELKSVVEKYKGHLIATSACMGGELSTNAYQYSLVQNVASGQNEKAYYENNINNFIDFCLELFGDDFYIECAPSTMNDQIATNKMLFAIAKANNIKMTVGTDAHYLTKEDRFIHKAYLNSKDGDREVDSFYEFARLMDYNEVKYLLSLGLPNAEEILNNTLELQNKIENYSLAKKQGIPKVEVKDYPKTLSYFGINNDLRDELDSNWPTIKYLLTSDNIQDRYWINECLQGLLDKGLWNDEYISRIEIEADVIKFIGEKLDDCLFAYFNTFKHYIDLFWECGSIVGPGRGSATGFLSNYLLGITQLDPIRWSLPYWRFLNKERAELPDIDIDLAPSKRPAIFDAIRKERGEFGLIQVATFGTEGTKSAILTACRGYRSDEYPEGIDVDEAQYMSSLIPQERGFLWSINDVVYGNEEKDRKPVALFVNTVNQYPGLLDIITSICGIINKRSSHASGVMLYDENIYDTASVMRTPSGDLITCFDLHMAEAAGDTKYDFLVTEISDKIIQCYELLKADKEIDDVPLRKFYNDYIHPEVMDTSLNMIWEHLAAGDVLDVFQFSTGVGLAIAKKLKPSNPAEMTAANAMMRLMSEKDKESQQDRYVRIQKNGLDIFEREMQINGLNKEQRELMHKHCDKYWGCCAIQEQMMEILMDIAHFTLGEANAARKVVAKKQMSKIPDLKKQVYDKLNDANVATYIWETAVAPQLGYAFSLNHSLPYSFVGIQSIYLAARFNPIYWNTACLIVNSGATDETAGKSTDYGKIAKAIGDIMSSGIKVSLANINKSDFGFKPDVENNQILYGLKGLLNVGDDLISEIIAKRPYKSIRDFMNKVNVKKQSMISLIKAGAFDEMMDRKICMGWYIWETCDKKKNLTLQNMPGLTRYGLLPTDTEERKTASRIYEFNRYLKAVCKHSKEEYKLDTRAMDFLCEMGYEDLINDNMLNAKQWDKKYQTWMDIFRNWIAGDKANILYQLNSIIFKEAWDKYAKGNISAWEMEAMCFYYHEHELAHLNNDKYGFKDFFTLPEEPIVERSFYKGGKTINIFELCKICGTCIAKDKTKSTVTLLTTTGVVTVKFNKEYFSMFDKQISQKNADGTKSIKEKSWFNRGNMIVVNGMRNGDNFVAKKYAADPGHTLYRISSIDDNGNLELQIERYKGIVEDSDD